MTAYCRVYIFRPLPFPLQPWPQSQDPMNREVRQQRFAHFTELAIMSVQEIVDFAKQLPGFLELTREDQIALLKTSTIEVSLPSGCFEWFCYHICVPCYANMHRWTNVLLLSLPLCQFVNAERLLTEHLLPPSGNEVLPHCPHFPHVTVLCNTFLCCRSCC